MSERETCLTLLKTHGYLSRNLLARFLKIQLKDSRVLLESILPMAGVVGVFTTYSERKVVLSNQQVSGSTIYAVGLADKQQEFFDIEMNLKSRFYDTDDLIYPPADSGIFIQEKRKIAYKDKVVKNKPVLSSATVKASVNKQPYTALTSAFIKSDSSLKQNSLSTSIKSKPLQELPAKNMNSSRFSSILMSEPHKKPKIEHASNSQAKNEFFSDELMKPDSDSLNKNEIKSERKTSNTESKQNPIKKESFFDSPLKTSSESLKTEFKSEATEIKELIESKPKNEKSSQETLEKVKKIAKKAENHSNDEKEKFSSLASPVKPKPNQKPSSSKQLKDELNDILSNKNLYNTEEDEETLSASPAKVESKLKSSKPVASTIKPAAKKEEKPASKFFNSDAPLVHKRKVMKTRTIIENGKMITEDYSSEEEVILHRPQNVIAKKEGVQMKINFFKKVA